MLGLGACSIASIGTRDIQVSVNKCVKCTSGYIGMGNSWFVTSLCTVSAYFCFVSSLDTALEPSNYSDHKCLNMTLNELNMKSSVGKVFRVTDSKPTELKLHEL